MDARFTLACVGGMLALSCKPSTPRSPRYTPIPVAQSTEQNINGNSSVGGNASTPEEKSEQLVRLAAQNTAEKNELKLLGNVNEKFCVRLDRMRNECVASVRLISDASERILGCDGNFRDNAAVSHKFTASMTGGFGTYRLVADRAFYTGEFSSGSNELNWTASGNTDVEIPKLMDVSSLRLERVDGDVPDLTGVDFTLSINETQVFTKADLVPGAQNTYWSINPQKIDEIRKSSVCTVQYDELDSLIAEAKSETGASGSGNGSDADQPSASLDVSGLNPTEVESLLDTVKSEIGARLPSLERERDRNGKLRRELLAETASGCNLNLPIETLEILVEGDMDFNRGVGLGKSPNPKTDEGNPDSYVLELGENFSKTFTNAQTGLFQPSGKLVFTDVGDRKVRDIEFIRLARKGWKVDNRKETYGCGFLGFGSCTRYEYFEVERARLFGLTIKVNDKVLFEKKGLDVSLGRDSLEWGPNSPNGISTKTLQANEAFIKLMREDDCVQTQ